MAPKRASAWCAMVALVASACGSGGMPTKVDVPFPVTLTINDQPTGTFFCRDGLALATRLTNPTSKPLTIQALAFQFSSPECGANDLTVQAGGIVAPGETAAVRRIDVGGDLCAAPNGRTGCTWDVTARVDTDAGVATGRLWFATFKADRRTCGTAAPRLLQPANGALVSGDTTLSLQPAPIADPATCDMPGTQVRIYPLYGGPPVLSDFTPGTTYEWDSRGVRNADYLIALQSACGVCERCACGGVDASVVVTVRN